MPRTSRSSTRSTREYVEPDWTRLPGYRDVTTEQWETAQWQRAHTVKNLKEFKEALGDFLDDDLLADIERDQQERATMSMLIPPQMINTMEEHDLRHDRVRNYMAPALSDRQTEWTSHPMSSRDSLHEADMWAVEGLTHRYPTKVLAELIPTCPQYCGHCTRMDLVGNDTLQVLKYKFEVKQNDRWDQMLDYLRKTPQVRDVVVSGGDMANVPIKRLEDFVSKLLDIENIRDIRIASKGSDGAPAALPAGRRPCRARVDGDEGPLTRRRHRAAHARELRAAGDAARRQGRAG